MSARRIASRNDPPKPLQVGDVVEAMWHEDLGKHWVKGRILQEREASEDATNEDPEFKVEFINQGSGKDKKWVSGKFCRRFGQGAALESPSTKKNTAPKPIAKQTPTPKPTTGKRKAKEVSSDDTGEDTEKEHEDDYEDKENEKESTPVKGKGQKIKKKSIVANLELASVTQALNGESRFQTSMVPSKSPKSPKRTKIVMKPVLTTTNTPTSTATPASGKGKALATSPRPGESEGDDVEKEDEELDEEEPDEEEDEDNKDAPVKGKKGKGPKMNKKSIVANLKLPSVTQAPDGEPRYQTNISEGR
jgi:hypothetical protein